MLILFSTERMIFRLNDNERRCCKKVELKNAKSLFEEMGGRYERQGDYLIPCLTVPDEEEQPISLFGQQHLRYLKQYRRVTYINLLTSKKEIDGTIYTVNMHFNTAASESIREKAERIFLKL